MCLKLALYKVFLGTKLVQGFTCLKYIQIYTRQIIFRVLSIFSYVRSLFAMGNVVPTFKYKASLLSGTLYQNVCTRFLCYNELCTYFQVQGFFAIGNFVRTFKVQSFFAITMVDGCTKIYVHCFLAIGNFVPTFKYKVSLL